MSAKRHDHSFTALWTHFGPYGDESVHYHPCITGAPVEPGECSRVLIGEGRECDRKPESHHRETLGASS